jgi:hypothetical protein
MALQIRGDLYESVTNESIKAWLAGPKTEMDIGCSFSDQDYNLVLFLSKRTGDVEIILPLRGQIIFRMKVEPMLEHLLEIINPNL